MFRRKEYLVVASFALLGFLIINSDLISFGVSKSLSTSQALRSKAPASLVNISNNLPLSGDVENQEEEGELKTGISLQGTDIPDGLMTDAHGDLKVTLHLKQFFDYFYTLLGRKTEEDINRIIEHQIENKLAGLAKQQALTILRNYQLLQEKLHTLPVVAGNDINSLQSLEYYLEERDNLRNQYLGSDVSEIFYGMEQTYDQYSLERMKIASNLALSEEERIRASEDIFSSLPPELRQPIEKRRQLKAIREQAHNPDASIETLFQQRESIVGYEVAEKLQALDVSREQWKERYDYYQQRVQQISESGLSSVDKVQAIKQIRQRLFKTSEIKRVNSLDRIAGRV